LHLDAIKPISDHRDFIFPSVRDPKRHTDSETINKALGKMSFKGRTTAHGLRSLASTTLNEQGSDSDVIEAALAHQQRNRIRAAYNRTKYLDKRRELMKWIDIGVGIEMKRQTINFRWSSMVLHFVLDGFALFLLRIIRESLG